MKTVAVAVPIYKQDLSLDETVSLRHLEHFLPGYDTYFVAPCGLDISHPSFRKKQFPPHFFQGVDAYSSLLLSKEFYRAFSDYKYILIYQLDALVFSDQLLEWCKKDYDYIGAPWIKCKDADFIERPAVGNGGFSLRRVEGFLRVLESRDHHLSSQRKLSGPPSYRFSSYMSLIQKCLNKIMMLSGIKKLLEPRELRLTELCPNEDLFWSFEARKYYRGFKIAAVEDALSFAFEVSPRECFRMNGNKIPFGCHAWGRYDRSFWEPYLLQA